MLETNQTQQQTIIEYNLPRKINLGDVIYTIEETDKKYYYEPCKVCEGKGNLTVNGVTFSCPCCRDYRSPFSIARYKVTRWRVYEIAQMVSTGYWKASDNKTLIVKVYTTTSRGYGNTKDKRLTEYNFKHNRNADADRLIEASKSQYKQLGDFIFDCYSLACEVADKLNEFEEQKVIEHNKANNTNYELPPKPEYDPKSN